MRVEQIGDCTLYLADCMDVLPTLGKVDAVVTDPPYGLGAPSGTLSLARAHKRSYISTDDTEANVIDVYVPAIKAALRLSGGRGLVTPGGKNAWHYPKPDVLGGFYQPASCGMCAWGRQTFQPILFYGKDPNAGKTIQHTTYLLTEAASTDLHPCAKPMKATQWMVGRVSVENETILDPFMGSGTTGVACVKMGRKFIGIEREESYFEIACKRIREAYAQPDMFVEPPKQMKQDTLL